MTDPNQKWWERTLTLVSRFTWEFPNTFVGNSFSHIRNNTSKVNITYYNGATLVNHDDGNGKWGVTVGSYINGNDLKANPEEDKVFAHEYGHTKQSQILGPLYLPLVGIPSLTGSVFDYDYGFSNDHDREWYEVWANQLSYNYFEKQGYSTVTSNWDFKENPIKQNPDWFSIPTAGYYVGLTVLSILIVL